jgi:hypothetical protein
MGLSSGPQLKVQSINAPNASEVLRFLIGHLTRRDKRSPSSKRQIKAKYSQEQDKRD